MSYCKMVNDPIDAEALARRVSGPRNGAVLTFVGQVRNHSQGKTVAFLEYDAYVPMAEKEMLRIATEASNQWDVDVVMEHRIGKIGLCEASIVICVGSPHRAEAFEACRFCIDTLKDNVPIWKKETCPDGSFWIEGDQVIAAE